MISKITFLISITIVTISFFLLESIKCQTRNTTYDSDFVTTYKAIHIRSGDNQTYPINGDNVTVHYNGTFPTTGQSFDSSYSRNKPFSFFLNFGNVIKCWDNVLAKMSLGERIYVVCPYNQAYGVSGTTNIPGSTDIAFDIDFLCINNNCQPKAVVSTVVPNNTIVIKPSTITSGSFELKNRAILGSLIAIIIAILF